MYIYVDLNGFESHKCMWSPYDTPRYRAQFLSKCVFKSCILKIRSTIMHTLIPLKRWGCGMKKNPISESPTPPFNAYLFPPVYPHAFNANLVYCILQFIST